MEGPNPLRVPELLDAMLSRLDDDTVRIARTVCRLWHDRATALLKRRAGAGKERYALTKGGATKTPAILEMSKLMLKYPPINVVGIACKHNNLATAKHVAKEFGVAKRHIRMHNNYIMCITCEKGHLNVLQWVMEAYGLDVSDIHSGKNRARPLALAAQDGHLPILQWTTERFDLPINVFLNGDESIFYVACANNRIEIVKWLSAKFDIPALGNTSQVANMSLFNAVSKGSTETMNWLIGAFGMTSANIYVPGENTTALAIACGNGYLETAKHLTQLLGLTAEDARAFWNEALKTAARNGQLAMIQWLVKKFELGSDDVRDVGAMPTACAHGHLAAAEWLANTFNLNALDMRWSDAAAVGHSISWGRLDSLKWLDQRYGITVRDLEADYKFGAAAACYNDYLQVVQWLAGKFEASAHLELRRMFRYAIIGAGLDVAKWMLSHFGKAAVKLSAMERRAVMFTVCADGRLEVAQWIEKNLGYNLASVRISSNKLLITACANGHLPVAQWLVNHYGLTKADAMSRSGAAMRLAQHGHHHDVVHWLTTEFGIEPFDNEADTPKEVYRLLKRYTTSDDSVWSWDGHYVNPALARIYLKKL